MPEPRATRGSERPFSPTFFEAGYPQRPTGREDTRRRKRWGVTIMELDDGDRVASVTVVPENDGDEQ